MKIIKTILDKPYLIILIAALIALVSPDRYFLHAFALISLIFLVSIIYIISQKKWLRLTFTIIGFFVFFLSWTGVMLFKGLTEDLTPKTEIADSKFYSNEILKTSNINIPNELKLISKLDTILYVGVGGDYNAECLYTGPKKLIAELENDIISKKEFSNVNQLEDYPTTVLTKNNFNLNELKSVYKKESQGSYIVYIAFNKSHTKFYYSAFYY